MPLQLRSGGFDGFDAVAGCERNGVALGQECRKRMRRMDHKIWKAKERREDPLKLMEASMHGRVPALVSLKYERMAASPFGYFRGAVPVMAYDLSLVREYRDFDPAVRRRACAKPGRICRAGWTAGLRHQ